MKTLKYTLLLILLLSCSSKVVNHREAYVLVFQAHRIVQNNDNIPGKDGQFSFAFVSSGSKGLIPIIYINGNISINISPDDPKRPGVKQDVTYEFKYRFKKPGRATVMFIWESKNHFGQPFTLNLEYL